MISEESNRYNVKIIYGNQNINECVMRMLETIIKNGLSKDNNISLSSPICYNDNKFGIGKSGYNEDL